VRRVPGFRGIVITQADTVDTRCGNRYSATDGGKEKGAAE
jgi:hypothetical protein